MPDPKTLTPEDWEHLLDLASDKSRDNYLVFLYLKNKRKQTAQVQIPFLRIEQIKLYAIILYIR